MTTLAAVEVYRILTVSMLVNGAESCYCGRPAVILVDTEPDNEPGFVCHEHYAEWVRLTTGNLDRMYGPEAQARKAETP